MNFFFSCAKYFSASLLEGHLLDLEISAENHVVVGLKEWQLCLEYRGFIMEKAPPLLYVHTAGLIL